MPAAAFAAYLRTYAQRMEAPVICGVEVTKVEPSTRGYRVTTNAGQWLTRSVVIARTGACNTPDRPPMAAALASTFVQISPTRLLGARSAAERRRAGGRRLLDRSATRRGAPRLRPPGKVLAVGEHTRVPRRYRGRDIYAWMETAKCWTTRLSKEAISPPRAGSRPCKSSDNRTIREPRPRRTEPPGRSAGRAICGGRLAARPNSAAISIVRRRLRTSRMLRASWTGSTNASSRNGLQVPAG